MYAVMYCMSICVPVLFCSGFFNGAKFFSVTGSGAQAAGAMYMIMGFLWFLGAPLAIVMVVLVSTAGIYSVPSGYRHGRIGKYCWYNNIVFPLAIVMVVLVSTAGIYSVPSGYRHDHIGRYCNVSYDSTSYSLVLLWWSNH